MPDISIGNVTEAVQVDVAETSLLGKSKIQALQTAKDLEGALSQPVAGSKFKTANFASTFAKSGIPLQGNAVAIKASVNSTLTLANSSSTPLFGNDDYDPVAIAEGDSWISFKLDTLLDTSIAVPLPNGFGVCFEASTAPSFASWLLVPKATAPTKILSAAIRDLLNAFTIVDSAAAVTAIQPGVICTADLCGTIKVGGSWSLPIAVNQLSLADANLPFNTQVAVQPALTLSVSGDIVITGEFNVRAHRVNANTIRLGIFKKHQTQFDVAFTAASGLAANVGKTDLIGALFQAVSSNIDTSALPAADAANCNAVLKTSINRCLSLSLNASCSAANSDEAAIVYEIDTSGADPDRDQAIAQALHGDWTALAHLKSARKLRHVIIDTVERKFCWNINVLGIYNYGSLNDFIKGLRILHNQEDGSIVITDSITAKRIAVASTPLAADGDKLRAALYEGFMATIVYKALLAGTGVDIAAHQDLLYYRASLGYRDALKELLAGEVLNAMPVSVRAALPPAGAPVHQARFAAHVVYNNDDVLRFFFSDITALTPRQEPEVKRLGREVLASLLDPRDTVDQARIAVLRSDDKWAWMDAHPSATHGPSYSDWFDVTTWADAIVAVAPRLADAIRSARSAGPDPSANPDFMKKRAALASALDGVTHNMRAAYEPGFPICVMTRLCGGRPGGVAPVFEASWNSKTVFSNAKATAAASG